MTQPEDSGIIIRRAMLKDREAVAALVRAAPTAAQWPLAAYDAFFQPKFGSGGPGPRARVIFVASDVSDRARPFEGLVEDLVETSPNELLGFAAYSVVLTPEFSECELENMVTAGEWRRRGIAQRLLRAGFQWCAAYQGTRIWLEVRASNAAAIALYQKFGFVVWGKGKAYYAQPVEDAVRMEKTLSGEQD